MSETAIEKGVGVQTGGSGVRRTAEELAAVLRGKLGGKIVELEIRSPRRIYMEVVPAAWRETALYVWGELRCRFNIATGAQTPAGFEVLYHFAFDDDGVELSIRVHPADAQKPVLPSVADRIKAFLLIEREIHDLIGIAFEGHPALTPLLRSEDWPEDFFPLRRTEPRAELDYHEHQKETGK